MTREERYPGATWRKPLTRHTITFVPAPDALAQVNAVLPADVAREIAQALEHESYYAHCDVMARYADLMGALTEPEASMMVTVEELDA